MDSIAPERISSLWANGRRCPYVQYSMYVHVCIVHVVIILGPITRISYDFLSLICLCICFEDLWLGLACSEKIYISCSMYDIVSVLYT